MNEGRQWCIVVRSDNPHDFEVWGPYSDDETDEVWERLADRPDVGRLSLDPLSRDWDAENE